MKYITLCMLMAAVSLAGCATDKQFLDSKQAAAVQTAENRARFEMNCKEAAGTVLSRTIVQPAVMAPRYGGIDRAEYTVGVAGCGKRETYVVACPDGGDGCFAADGRGTSTGQQ